MSTNSNLISVGSTTPIPEQTFYSSTPPTSTAGYSAGDTYYVTPLGTQADSANATEEWRYDGTKWVKTPSGESTPTGQNVYFNSENPATGTIFDTENPPVTNNDALKEDSANTYYGTDGSVWTWNGTAYITKTYNFTTQKRNEFTATANQTAFTISTTPIGQLYGYRNGVKLPTAWSWVGVNVTYLPAGNGSKTIDAGDVISFEYEAY
jgi:hypothetical protein